MHSWQVLPGPLFADFWLQRTERFIEDAEQAKVLSGDPDRIFNDSVKHDGQPGLRGLRYDSGYLLFVQTLGQVIQLLILFLHRCDIHGMPLVESGFNFEKYFVDQLLHLSKVIDLLFDKPLMLVVHVGFRPNHYVPVAVGQSLQSVDGFVVPAGNIAARYLKQPHRFENICGDDITPTLNLFQIFGLLLEHW